MAVLAASGFVQAQNVPPGWHQIGGPNRIFHVESPPLAESWPEDGDLAIASVGVQGLEVHAQAPILT